MIRLARVGVIACVSAGFVGWIAPGADAHDWLVSSDPASGAHVRHAPSDIRLTFNAPALTKPAPPRVAVIGPGGRHYETGCASVTDATVRVPWQVGPKGEYSVEWRIVSSDGHPVSSHLTFTYDGAPGAAKGAANAPACASMDASPGSATEAGRAASTSAGKKATASGGDNAPLVVAGLAAALAAVAAVVMLVRSRRHAESDAFDDDDDAPHA